MFKILLLLVGFQCEMYRVDTIERNYFYGEDGKLIFVQYLFFDIAEPVIYDEATLGMELLDCVVDTGRKITVYHKGGSYWLYMTVYGKRKMKVCSNTFYESHTYFDTETVYKILYPLDTRRSFLHKPLQVTN